MVRRGVWMRRSQGRGRRKILIGTFFGPTPWSAEKAHEARNGWRQTSAGLICEYLHCPTPDCDGDMAWRDADRRAGRERLECVECSTAIESDEIILTRERLRREAPDILFTTTEMLNQRMGDSNFRHLFGIGDRAQRPVEMMLLDEVHTYTGSSGCAGPLSSCAAGGGFCGATSALSVCQPRSRTALASSRS